jgi:hypothetical protein
MPKHKASLLGQAGERNGIAAAPTSATARLMMVITEPITGPAFQHRVPSRVKSGGEQYRYEHGNGHGCEVSQRIAGLFCPRADPIATSCSLTQSKMVLERSNLV